MHRYRELIDRFQAKHPGVVRDARIIKIPGNTRPWLDTNVDLLKDDRVSVLAEGSLIVNPAASLSLLPRVVLWARVGDANVFRFGSDTHTFVAQNAGRLRLANLQGRWATPQGDHPAPTLYDRFSGAIEALVIRWGDVEPKDGLAMLGVQAPHERLIAEESRRLEAPLIRPTNFEELWFVGSGANFTQTEFDGEPGIALRSERNGGIIRSPVEIPLQDGASVEWDWRANQLPSVRAEDVMPFHEYASIAVEFDDGQDLSWYWSATLPQDKHYICPLPGWPGETHLVIRSGAAGLGTWVHEQRDVSADIALALKNKPTRITGVWLIALTAFGERSASVDFRRITIVDGSGRTHRVFPI